MGEPNVLSECHVCWHTRGAHQNEASDHGECTHYGCDCDVFVEIPAPPDTLNLIEKESGDE